MAKKHMLFVKPELEMSDSIAIVGSSGSLRDTQYGTVIDSFDEIVRFNRAPVDGYEDMVGSKTTLRVINQHVATNTPVLQSERDQGFWLGQNEYFVRDLRDANLLHYGMGFTKEEIAAANIHESNSLYIFDFAASGVLNKLPGEKKEIRLSVGLGFIMICVHSGIVPHLFGFDVRSGRPRDHYWENRPGAGPCHNIPGEKKFLAELVKNNKVKLQ